MPWPPWTTGSGKPVGGRRIAASCSATLRAARVRATISVSREIRNDSPVACSDAGAGITEIRSTSESEQAGRVAAVDGRQRVGGEVQRRDAPAALRPRVRGVGRVREVLVGGLEEAEVRLVRRPRGWEHVG